MDRPDAGVGIRGLWIGFSAWLVFGVLALALRGVQWDENYEFAQVILGRMPYPEGHPLPSYANGAYNLQFFLSALVLRMFPNPAVLCGLRNLIFIWATVIPVYLLAAILSRKALWGHAATVLVLAGVHLAFDGAYPQFLWPGMFSNGHIGMAWALITVCLLVDGRLRAGLFMFALMPAVHLGQLPALLVFAGLYLAGAWHEPETRRALMRAAPFLGAGAILSIVFWFIQRTFALPPPADGPYAVEGDARAIWEGAIQYHDMHRRIPRGNSHLIAVGILFLSLLGLRSRRMARLQRRAWLWFSGFAGGTVLIVYGIMSLHFVLGADIPYIFLGWLPYRLANHLPIILVAMLTATLARDGSHGARARACSALVTASLVFLLLRPWLGALTGAGFRERYMDSGESVLFFLYGAAIASLLAGSADRRATRPWAVAAVLGLMALGAVHQFGAACTLAGAIAGALSARIESGMWAERWGRMSRPLLRLVLLVSVAGILSGEHARFEYLPIGAFEMRVADHLARVGAENAMLVAGPYQVLLQAQTGHPVLVDMATGFHASYVPSLAPAIRAIYTDLYGIDLKRPYPDVPWTEFWRKRSRAEWRELAQRYGFSYVVAPNATALDMVPVLSGENDTLYRVFDGPETG